MNSKEYLSELAHLQVELAKLQHWVQASGTRIVVLFEGRAIYFGPVADLEKSPHPHIQEFLAMDRVS